MKVTNTTEGCHYVYIDSEQDCSFECGEKQYVQYTVCMRFKPKDKIDKRFIYVYSLSMFAKKGLKTLNGACEKSIRVPWNSMEKSGDYYEIEGKSFNKIKNKKIKELIISFVDEAVKI